MELMFFLSFGHGFGTNLLDQQIVVLQLYRFEDRNIISYGAAISACERAEKWQLAVSLLNDLLSNLQGWEPGTGNLHDLGGVQRNVALGVVFCLR